MTAPRFTIPLKSALLLTVLGAGCQPGTLIEHAFVLAVDARASAGAGVPDVVVLSPDGVEVGRTGADGRSLIYTEGREGAAVEFLVRPPPGVVISEGTERRRIILRRLRSMNGRPSPVNVVEHTVYLRQRKLPYVFMPAANVPDLPVVAFGAERTRLNERGVNIFTYEGLPGDEVALTLLTDSDPMLVPRNPQRTFQLPDEPTHLFWRPALQRLRPPPPRPKKPKRSRGPTAL
jgi:hypothetical protein